MWSRTGTLAAAALAALAATGCGEKCNEQVPVVTDMQESCTAVAGQPITVQIRTCPRCDQGTPHCEVRMDNLGAGFIQLEPLSEVCEESSSCPIVDRAACAFQPVGCTFLAPPASGSPYTIVVFGPNGEQVEDTTLTVVASGSSPGCAPF